MTRTLECSVLVLLFVGWVSGCRDGSPLHRAVASGDAAAVKRIIARGGDVNAKDGDGNTPLHLAGSLRPMETKAGAIAEIVEALLAHGADPNAKNNNGVTTLHYATIPEIARILIANGSDVNARSDSGSTPLHWQVQWLQGAIMVVGRDGRETITRESFKQHRELLKVLIESGADVNAKSVSGETALYKAVRSTGSQIGLRSWAKQNVEILIAAGADVNAKDSTGQTPIEGAKSARNTEVVDLLRKHGAKE